MNKIRIKIVIAVVGCLVFGQSFATNNAELRLSEPLRAVVTESHKAVDGANDYMNAKIKRDMRDIGLAAGAAGTLLAGSAHLFMSKTSSARTVLRFVGSVIAVLGFSAAAAAIQ